MQRPEVGTQTQRLMRIPAPEIGRRGRAASVALVVAVVALGAYLLFGRASWPHLGIDGGRLNPGVGESFPLGVGHPESVGGVLICLSRPGSAKITAVRPYHVVGGFKVEAYAVRPDPYVSGRDSLGNADGPLTSNGFGTDHVVDVKCDRDHRKPAYELGLQVTRTTSADAGAAGFDVYYRSQGHTGMFTVPYAQVACSGNGQGPGCANILNALTGP